MLVTCHKCFCFYCFDPDILGKYSCDSVTNCYIEFLSGIADRSLWWGGGDLRPGCDTGPGMGRHINMGKPKMKVCQMA